MSLHSIHDPEAVIFDMDGVIIDSEPVYFEIENKSFQAFGLTIPQSEQLSFVGITLEEMWRRIKNNYSLTQPVEELLEYHKGRVLQHMDSLEGLQPIQGIRHLINELKQKGIKTAVASSSPTRLIELILAKLGMKNLFDVIVSGEDVEEGKPLPHIFLKTAQLLDTEPCRCIVIEDSYNGIIAARCAGMHCIGFKNPHSGSQDLSQANRIISAFSELHGIELTAWLHKGAPNELNKTVLIAAPHLPTFYSDDSSAVSYKAVKKLAESNIDIRFILPFSRNAGNLPFQSMNNIGHAVVNIDEKNVGFKIKSLSCGSIVTYFIDSPHYFDRDELCSYPDDAGRWVFFSRAVLEALRHIGFKPDIIHCQNWPTAIIPLMLKLQYNNVDFYKNIKTVLTFSDLRRQGVFDKENSTLFNMSWNDFTRHNLDYYGHINFLKSGLIYADAITTASPNYAREITTGHLGETLEDVIKTRRKDIYGILSGIDPKENDPATDKRIYANYSTANPKGKRINKRLLQKELGLETNPCAPLLFFNSRLKDEKGTEFIKYTLDYLIKDGAQVIMTLPSEQNPKDGEEIIYEEYFRKEAQKHKTKFSLIPSLAHLIYKAYAASDILLLPSVYEPCGVNQLIAMRYGTVPLVRKTGGLVDTVTDFDESTGDGTGFHFEYFSIDKVFLYTVRKALRLYKHKDSWARIVKNCMKQDYGLDRFAAEYASLYNKVLTKSGGTPRYE